MGVCDILSENINFVFNDWQNTDQQHRNGMYTDIKYCWVKQFFSDADSLRNLNQPLRIKKFKRVSVGIQKIIKVMTNEDSLAAQMVKNPSAYCRKPQFNSWAGKSPGGRYGNPFQ